MKAASSDMAVNSFWLILSSVFNMVLGVFVVAVVARYFGPETFGRFSYALSLVLLFAAISSLGLETLTVASLVSGEYPPDTIVGTSLALRFAGGAILTMLAVLAAAVLEPSDSQLRLLVALLSLMMVFKSIDVIDYWFQSKFKSKTTSLVRMASYTLAGALKIGLVWYGGNIYHYAALFALDALLVGIGFTIAYRGLTSKGSRWSFDPRYAKSILSRSWYIMLSGLMVTLYMRVDQVMLGYMYPDKAVLGVYAAAITLSSMWYFVPTAIIASASPKILRDKRVDRAAYERHVQDLFTLVAWITLGFSFAIAAAAGVLVSIVYGSAFSDAGGLLRLTVFSGVFALLGSARGTWLISEGLQRYSVIYIGAGAVINICLNLYLIPLLGAYGAVIATLAAQASAVLLIPAIFRNTRVSTRMMIRAFSLPRAIDLGRRLVSGG